MFRNARILIRDSSDVGRPDDIYSTVAAKLRALWVAHLARSTLLVNEMHVIVPVLYQIRVGCVRQPHEAWLASRSGSSELSLSRLIRPASSGICVPAAH